MHFFNLANDCNFAFLNGMALTEESSPTPNSETFSNKAGCFSRLTDVVFHKRRASFVLF
jgi:hypothetical protein